MDADARWSQRCTTTSASTVTSTATRSAWFDGLQASCDDRAETTIIGRVADQATVHGLPAKVRDLGLKLTLVRRIDPDYPEGQWISRERERLGRHRHLDRPGLVPQHPHRRLHLRHGHLPRQDLLGLVSKSVGTASNLPFPLTLLPLLASGFVPTDSLPVGLRWFAENQPFTPIIETLRGLLFGTAIGSSGWIALGWCVLLTFVGYIWGRSLYDRDPQPR